VGVDLSFENGKQLLIPAGFLHGFVTRVPDTEIVYKCTDYYSPTCDGAVRFDDPAIGINWQLEGEPLLSDKDADAGFLSDLDNPFIFESISRNFW
jgi:dTDP-4-dehydrorhamnose 3,5-epimerase